MAKKTTKTPKVQKDVEPFWTVNADCSLRNQIRSREDALRDYNSSMSAARAKARKKGFKEGFKEGFEKAQKEGRLAKQKEFVDKMRKVGLSEDVIRAVLGDDYKRYAVG